MSSRERSPTDAIGNQQTIELKGSGIEKTNLLSRTDRVSPDRTERITVDAWRVGGVSSDYLSTDYLSTNYRFTPTPVQLTAKY